MPDVVDDESSHPLAWSEGAKEAQQGEAKKPREGSFHSGEVEQVPPGACPPDSLRPRTEEHGWPGKLWVGWSWFSFWLFVAGMGLMTLGLIANVFDPPTADYAIGAVVAFLVTGIFLIFYYFLIRAVRDFQKWGWIVVAFGLPLAFLGNLMGLSRLESSWELLGIVVVLSLTIIWMWYFWDRRADYGISTGSDDAQKV